MSFTEKHLRAQASIVVAGRTDYIDPAGAGTDPIERRAAHEFPTVLRHLLRPPKPDRAGHVADLAPAGRVSD